MLVAGGYNFSSSALNSAELYDVGLGFSSASQATISTATSPLTLGTALTLSGTQFTGYENESASGGATSDSASNIPVVQVTSQVNEQQVFLNSDPASPWSATGYKSLALAGLPQGYASVRMFVNGIPSGAAIILLANATPTANAQSVNVGFNTATVITLTGSDPNSPPQTPLTFALGATPSSGALSGFNASTGAVTYTPTAGFYGTDSLTFTVTNTASKNSSAATVSIVVAAGTPTATPQTVNVAFGTATAIMLSGSDPNSPPQTPLTFALGATPSSGALSGFNASTGAVTYTPTAGFYGTADSFTFTVTNTASKTGSAATVSIVVVAAGTPTANPQTVNVAFNFQPRRSH